MTSATEAFVSRLDRLRADLVQQGRRVQTVLEAAFEALFERDSERAEWVIAQDDTIDKVDLQIEQAAVDLLSTVAEESVPIDPADLRSILVIVKVNNELERAADAAVEIAERVGMIEALGADMPPTVRVLANSIIGVVRDVIDAMDRSDPELAKVVLQSEDTIEAFLSAILRDAEERIANGSMTVDFAFTLHHVANQCVRMSDYCSNIAEQIIYASAGQVVRHTQGHWIEVPRPDGVE